MENITFKAHSLWSIKLEMVKYPELSSPKKWIQKGIDLLKKHAPRVLNYLSRERILSELDKYAVTLEVPPKKKRRRRKYKGSKRDKRVKGVFKLWIRKERAKRLIFVILEGLVIPFTPVLALLPGPNVFFYIPALLLFYHFTAYRGMRKVKLDQLNLKIVYH